MNKDGIVKLIINLYARQRVCKRARENNRGGQSLFLQSAYKIFSFVNRSYLLLMCGWGWRGSGVVAAAAGERCCVRRRRVEFGFFKKERKKVVIKQPLPA